MTILEALGCEMQKRMIATTLPGELADALEAQARRIAELEALLRQTNEGYAECIATREDYRARITELEAAPKDTTVRLVAAISLLERGGKKAAPSNTMFEQILVDYKNGVERARAALGEKE